MPQAICSCKRIFIKTDPSSTESLPDIHRPSPRLKISQVKYSKCDNTHNRSLFHSLEFTIVNEYG